MIANPPIRVLCVDDNYLVREAIRLQLETDGGFCWMGGLPSADSLSQAVNDLHPDVVLLDIDMPGVGAFQALRDVMRAEPNLRVLVVSGHVRRELIDQAVRAGAWGYLSKNEPAALADAIRKVRDGEFVMGPEIEQEYGLHRGDARRR